MPDESSIPRDPLNLPSEILPQDPPPQMARAVGQDPKVPEIRDPEERKRVDHFASLRRKTNRILQAFSSIRTYLEKIRREEDRLVDPSVPEESDRLRGLVFGVLDAQADLAEKIQEAITRAARHVIPDSETSVEIRVPAGRDLWAVHKSFQWPNPENPARTVTICPGEPIPKNMTEDQAAGLWERDVLRAFRDGLYYPHPTKVVDMGQAQAEIVVKQPVDWLRKFFERNTVTADTMIRMLRVAKEVGAMQPTVDLLEAVLEQKAGTSARPEAGTVLPATEADLKKEVSLPPAIPVPPTLS